MRTRHVCPLLFIVLFAVTDRASGQARTAHIEFPNPGKGWKAMEYERKDDAANIFQWAVYVHPESGDLLSFATRRVGPKESRPLIFLSDTAREIFPVGHPVWITPMQPTVSNTIRNHVIKIQADDGSAVKLLPLEALEYTLIVEVEEGRNRMVNGYAVQIDGLAVYVQNTSTNPITSDLAQEMVKSLVAAHRQREQKTNR